MAAKAGDQQYAQLLRKMCVLPESTLRFSPAQLHIDILGSYQKQGWGRKLIETAVEFLRSEGIDGVGW